MTIQINLHRVGILYDLNVGSRAFSANMAKICARHSCIEMSKSDDSKFSGMIPGVKRMHSDRINVYQQRARKPFVPRAQSEIVEMEADSRESIMPEPARAAHFNPGIQKKLQRKIRQGQIRPQDSLDLHGCRQAEALEALETFLHCSLEAGYRMVIIIHGQGFRSQSDAVLKPLVQRWLSNRGEVLAWCPAQPRDGAAGASYVYLRSGQ